MRKLFLIPFTLLLGACTVVGIRSGTEETGYTVEQTFEGGFEIRRYEARTYVETVVPRSDDGHRNTAFRALFDYISGANGPAEEIAMTIPVSSSVEGTEIAMTAPVQSSAGGENYRMRFFLPTSFTAKTAPKPANQAVRLGMTAPRREAVLRFSGSTADDAVDARKEDLLRWLSENGWRRSGDPVAYFYDPPWTLPFLKRNEVAVAVEPRS